ncbi:MAG: hypothetical protein RL624_1124 [Bacteroidota bacterium]|jgi:hypothetical protein
MKELFLLFSTIFFISCNKSETPISKPAEPIKTYDVTYEINCVGDYKTVFDFNYNFPSAWTSGNTYNQKITLGSTETSKTWSRTFLAVESKSYVSVYCKPPYTGTLNNYFSSYVRITIKYNGITYWSGEATSDTSGVVTYNGYLP